MDGQSKLSFKLRCKAITWLEHICFCAESAGGILVAKRSGSDGPRAASTKAACQNANIIAHEWVISICHWFTGSDACTPPDESVLLQAHLSHFPRICH